MRTALNDHELNTTLAVTLAGDGLTHGASVRIAITRTVDTPGTFRLGYERDATDG